MNSDESHADDSSHEQVAESETTKTSASSGGAHRASERAAAASSWNSPVSSSSEMSVIGPSLVIKGELEAGEDLLVEGSVEGTIKHTAERLLIGQRGKVAADIRARNVVIEGDVTGDVYGSESVSIKETATVCGNIFTPKVSISEGAHFKGGIDMDVENVQKH